MASTDDKDHAFFDEHEYKDDDDDFDEEEPEEFTGFSDVMNPNPNVSYASPLLPEDGVIHPASIPIHERKLTPFEDSRGPFQRIWTEEDEIVILEGFLDFVTRRGTTHNNYQHDTGPFYEEIKNKIQLDFSKNQLIEKIRRLKKKHRTVDSRMKAMGEAFAFKSAHEKVTYEISKHIWSSTTFKGPRNRRYNAEKSNFDGKVHNNGIMSIDPKLATVSSVVEETVKCCLSPLFKELLQHGPLLNSLPLSLSNGDKWKEQQILELEVYLKRVELLEEQIKATLEELRSSSSSMKIDD